MVTCQDSTRSELPWGVLALCRRTLGSERHRYGIAQPDKLGTDPMVYRGFYINKWTPPRNSEGVSHPIQPEYWEWAGWRGTGWLSPSRETKFSGTYGDKGIFIFPVQLTTSRIGNLTRLIHTLLYVMTIIYHCRFLFVWRVRRTFFPSECFFSTLCPRAGLLASAHYMRIQPIDHMTVPNCAVIRNFTNTHPQLCEDNKII